MNYARLSWITVGGKGPFLRGDTQSCVLQEPDRRKWD